MIRLDRLEGLLKEKHMSKRTLESKAGLGVCTVCRWKTSNGSAENIRKVADVLGVSVAFLTGESDFRSERDAVIAKWVDQQSSGLADEVKRIEAGIRIPVLGQVPCGIPIEAIEMIDAEDWEEISEKLARTGTFFGLTVKGDSMSPRIQEGDVLIIRQQEDADDGDIVIAKVNGYDACCKKLLKQDDGIILQSFNPCYSPMFFPNGEGVKIIGKVVENRQKF